MVIPHWLCKKIKSSEFENISKAIETAELKTSGEIVPIIISRSSPTGLVIPFLFTFIMLFTIFFLENFYFTPYHVLDLLIGSAVTLLIAIVLSKSNYIKRVVLPNYEMKIHVENRAFIEFHKHGFHQTKDSTGVLIFISILEKQVIILGDKSINDKLKPNVWNEIVQEMIHSIKDESLSAGLCFAIEKVGKILETHFPIQKNDKNELKNKLIILD